MLAVIIYASQKVCPSMIGRLPRSGPAGPWILAVSFFGWWPPEAEVIVIVVIDNFDSFVFNLAMYFRELDAPVRVIRSNAIPFGELDELVARERVDGIVISPGPKSPSECAPCVEAVRRYGSQVPILGVCLGHQVIAHAFGGRVKRARRPMHGKVTPITTDGTGLFRGLPRRFNVTRYHSLAVEACTLPERLRVNAFSSDGAVMAISHRSKPVYGVQFHPEAVLTEQGHEVLSNFLSICEGWKASSTCRREVEAW